MGPNGLVDAIPDGVYRLDPGGRVVAVNRALVALTGYDRERLVGAHVSAFVPDADVARCSALVREVLATDERTSGTVELTVERADGEGVPCELRLRVLEADGEVTGTVGVLRSQSGFSPRGRRVVPNDGPDTVGQYDGDRTEPTGENWALDRERDLVERILETSPVGIGVIEADGTIARANARAEELLAIRNGSLPDETGRDIYDEDGELIPPADRPSERVFATGDPVYDYPVQVDFDDGGRRWLSINAAPITDDDGAVQQVVVAGQDITELKESARTLERQRAELEAELREVFGRVDDAFFAVDDEWRFTYVNERASTFFERDRRALVGEIVWDLLPEEFGSTLRSAAERAMRGQDAVGFETEYDPTDRCFEVSVYPSETGLSVYFHDVTERRERKRELERYETIVETVNDGIYTADEDGQFTMVNEAYAELTGYDRDELVGADRSLVADTSVVEEVAEIERAMLDGDRQTETMEATLRTADGGTVPTEATFALLSLDSGIERIAVVHDITARREHERALEQYRTVTETASDVIVTLDESGHIQSVNPAVEGVFGYEPDDLVGEPITRLMPADLATRYSDGSRRYARSAERNLDLEHVELSAVHADGHEVPVAISFSEYEHDGERYFTGIVRDDTDRQRRERELRDRIRQQEAVTEHGQRALAETDLEGLFAETVERVAETLDTEFCKVLELDESGEELRHRAGVGWSFDVGDTTVPTGTGSQAGYTLRSEEPVIVEDLDAETRFDGPDLLVDHGVKSGMSVVIGPTDAPWGILGAHDRAQREFTEHDVNFLRSVATILATAIERARRERELERYESIVETVDDGVYVLDADSRFILVNDAFVELTGFSREQLLGATASMLHADPTDERLRDAIEAVMGGERDDALVELDVVTADGGSVPVETRFGPYRVDDERYGRVGVMRDITERKERERTLRQHRTQLSALNRLNSVVQDITRALVESSSRAEIEESVCDRIANAASYEFAWIGEVDKASTSVRPRARAGDDGYLDEVGVGLDGEDPVARSLRSRRTEVESTVDGDEPWQRAAVDRGVGSVAAVPLVYDGAVYGVLTIYASQPDAFDGRERGIVGHLGEIVGHAINAVERKEALMSESILEVEFRSRSAAAPFRSAAAEGVDAMTIERTLPASGDTYLQYVTVEGVAPDRFLEIVSGLQIGDDARLVSERGDEATFELSTTNPPVTSTVAGHGGRVRRTIVEGGELRLIAELPHSVDIRTVVSALREVVPDVELVSQRSIQRAETTPEHQSTVETLTDKQLTAVEAAYFAGYFDWPRGSTAEELASSMGVAAPTLHQHLRKGQRKLLSAYFGE